jgi:phage-related protein
LGIIIIKEVKVMGQYKIAFYIDKNGNCPFLDFFNMLKEETKNGNKQSGILFKAISLRLRHLKEIGTRKGMPDFDYIRSRKYPLWQIRIKHPRGIFRIFICLWGKEYYVILNYFWKKTKKIPNRQIQKAERMMDDFIRRNGSGD